MERKRKLPARAARVEGVNKKRASTPPESRNQPSPSVAPAPVVEEALPRSISAGKPLPTLDAPQPEDLSTREYQSVSESGVLVESLRRSRARWLSEGIFERYWTKPTAKTKGTPELANNPPKDSMTKLGTCTITVEPHIFEASMFAIKDPASRAAIPPTPQQPPPMYRPIIQYGPPNGAMPSPPPPKQILQPHQMHPTHPKPQDTPMANASSPQVAHTVTGAPDQPPRTISATPNYPPHNTTPNPPPANSPPAEPPAKRTDPVIQMLAEQAATDADLKALMKTVANGEASPAELKLFQSHIDQLTQLHKTRQAAKESAERKAERAAQQNNSNGNTPYSGPVSTDNARQAPKIPTSERKAQREAQQNNRGPEPTVILGTENIQPSPSHAPNHAPLAPTPHAHPLAPGPSHYQQPQPQALRSKGPVASTKPDISGVVFEFTGGSGDRFLFPKFSILEYLPQGQVIASFLIVRKGSSSDSPSYDPQLDYYQPITIRLYAHQGRQLDALQKIVAPPDEVRRYMDDIMDNMTRAEYVLLAMRLPRDTEPLPAAKEVETNQPIRMDDQVLWTTTNPTPVVQVPSVARLLTEEEKYQSFISTVAEKPV